METAKQAWQVIVARIMKQHKIFIEVEEIIGPYIKFVLETPIEKTWFMQIVKRNFFKIMESVPIENIEPHSFVINEKYSPNHIENFDIYEVTPPKMSDRINFNTELVQPTNNQVELASIKKTNLTPILSSSTMFINPKPPGFGEHAGKSIESFEDTVESLPVLNEEKSFSKVTWQEFFQRKGYCVSVRTKKDAQGKFLFHSLYFLSKLEKIKAMKGKPYFARYKFQSCEGQKRKFKCNGQKRTFKLFREYPDPE